MDLASPPQEQAEVTMSKVAWSTQLQSSSPEAISSGALPGWEAVREFLKSLAGGQGGGMVGSNVTGGGCWPPSPP